MKCPRCETELIEGSDKRPSFCHREAVGEQMVHLPDRCCDVLVGLLTKARRELEVDAIQILQLETLANSQQTAAAEERAAKAETEKAVAVKFANASLAAHVLTQGELDDAKREIVAYEKRIPQLCSDYLAQVHAAERERDAALRWDDDDKDEWTADIEAAFPTRSGSHDSYAIALRMVGHRRSKGALVALVNWLLVERATLYSERLLDKRNAFIVKDRDAWMSRTATAVKDRNLWMAHAEALRGAGTKLLSSLGEFVRQSMHFNPEWKDGIAAMEAALAADPVAAIASQEGP